MIEELSPIQNFYNGKVIFITGATGFVGKTLLRKLLKDCPGISHIYLLLREKRKIAITERMKEIFDNEIFNTVKEKQPLFEAKVSPILGNIDSPNLGLTSTDMELLKRHVNIVFHCASRVRFDSAIRLHVRSCIVATIALINIVKTFKNIQAFVYVSTQYCIYDEQNIVIEEKVMEKKISPTELIHISKWMDDSAIQTIFPKLVDGKFVPYFFAKAIAENAIKETCGSLPVVILRPSLIMAAFKEPFPGWCEAAQGLQELVLLILKGLLRTIYVKPESRMKIIPIDIVSNIMIVSAWYISLDKLSLKNPLVLNLSIEEEKLATSDKDQYILMYKNVKKYPLSNIFRYPDFTIYDTECMNEVHSFFDQYIPAILADAVMYLFTGKTMMLKINKLMRTIPRLRNYVTSPKRIFKMDNKSAIENALSTGDSEKFFMSLPENFNFDEYIENFVLGVRKYLAKEDLSNLEYAKKKAKVWWFVTSAFKWSVIYGACHMIGIAEYRPVFYIILINFIYSTIKTVF